MNFHASSVKAYSENGIAVVGFADDEFNPTQYVLLQRTLMPSEQDRNLGMDQPHVEIHPPTRSAYGGVDQVIVERGRLMLWLNNAMTRKVDNTSPITISFDLTTKELAETTRALSEVIGAERVHPRASEWYNDGA